MHKLGLIGKDISHSRSKEMYITLLQEDVEYSLLDYESADEIPSAIELFQMGFEGLSVTYPYKKFFIDQVTIDSKIVQDLSAINCLKYKDGVVFATNTDYLAAREIIKNLGHLNYLVLGSGNMSNVFKVVFKELGIEAQFFNRKDHGDLNQINYISHCQNGKKTILINCCSRKFVFDTQLPSNCTFWDMNYSFPEHIHLKKRNHEYREGTDLLLLQAKFALDFWHILSL